MWKLSWDGNNQYQLMDSITDLHYTDIRIGILNEILSNYKIRMIIEVGCIKRSWFILNHK